MCKKLTKQDLIVQSGGGVCIMLEKKVKVIFNREEDARNSNCYNITQYLPSLKGSGFPC